MLNLIKIAVTGGFACGKSTVCQIFREEGAYVVSADHIVHNLLSTSEPLKQKIQNWLGTNSVRNNQIDREYVANKVFKDPKLLKQLEALIHPEVAFEIEKEYEKAKCSRKNVFVAEIPLLFEASMESQFDHVVVVACDPEKAFSRSGKSREEFNDRVDNQMSLSEKIAKGHSVVYNNGSLEELRKQVKIIISKIQELA